MSPKGAQSFTRHASAVEQRREQAMSQFGPKADYFTLNAGEIAVVRFLEQGEELAYASCHRIRTSQGRYPNDVLCLDQYDDGTPCPFCASDSKEIRGRATKGFVNLIWRGGQWIQSVNQHILSENEQRISAGQPPFMTYALAPVYKRNQQGVPERDENTKQKIVTGYADGVFLWKCSNSAFQVLLEKDRTYRGAMSRDFTIRRQGATMQDTVYFIEPYDVDNPAQPMSGADLELAQHKYDLDQFITPMSFEDASKLLGGQTAPAGPQPTFPRGGVAPAPPPPGGGTPAPAIPDVNAGAGAFAMEGQPGQPLRASQPPIPPPGQAA
jgi:hypothetical protein